MCRKQLLSQITYCLEQAGFCRSTSKEVFTYEVNVKYKSTLIPDKNDYAHFVLYTPNGSIQIAAKNQDTTGTAIEKLAYTAKDASVTEYDMYLVVCGGKELLKKNKAIKFLNLFKKDAPKLHAIEINDLSNFLHHQTQEIAA